MDQSSLISMIIPLFYSSWNGSRLLEIILKKANKLESRETSWCHAAINGGFKLTLLCVRDLSERRIEFGSEFKLLQRFFELLFF